MPHQRDVPRPWSAHSEQWLDAARDVLDGFVDSMTACRMPADLMAEIARPAPIRIMCRWLGVSDDAAPAFRAWAETLLPGSGALPRQEQAAAAELAGFLGEVVDWHRTRAPAGPLMNVITDLSGDRSPADDQLVTALCRIVLAGSAAASALIGRGMWQVLAADGAWTGLVLGEESPGVVAKQVMEAGAEHLPADPAPLEGSGLGAALVRLKLEAVFTVLPRRFPRLRLAVDPEAVQFTAAGVPVVLPVEW